MKITSNAFLNNDPIPKKYTCQGENISPELQITDLPPLTKSLALIVDDPDAPGGVFDHWIVWNIPVTDRIHEGQQIGVGGVNHYRTHTYRGPCPPIGSTHHYSFKLFALDQMIDLPKGSSKEQLEVVMKDHILSQASLIGTFNR